MTEPGTAGWEARTLPLSCAVLMVKQDLNEERSSLHLMT